GESRSQSLQGTASPSHTQSTPQYQHVASSPPSIQERSQHVRNTPNDTEPTAPLTTMSPKPQPFHVRKPQPSHIRKPRSTQRRTPRSTTPQRNVENVQTQPSWQRDLRQHHHITLEQLNQIHQMLNEQNVWMQEVEYRRRSNPPTHWHWFVLILLLGVQLLLLPALLLLMRR
ncbi:MAG: hypothetical protein AAGJ35_06340, partial [Myxococcota bacterium]